MTVVHEGFRTGATHEGVMTEDVVDVADSVGIDIRELPTENVFDVAGSVGVDNTELPTEDVFDVADSVVVDFAELLCELAVFEDDEDLAVVLVVLGVVLLGTLMVVLTAYQPRYLLIGLMWIPSHR